MVRLLNVYTISAFAALGGALFGFDISSMSGVLGTDEYKQYYGNPLGARQGAITSAMAAGSLVGALSSSFLGDWLSRKVTIQLGTVLWCIGARSANAYYWSHYFRLGIGLTSSLVPIYQCEIAPRKIRGRVVALQHSALAWGIMIQYFIQYGCSFLHSQAAFRLPWAIQVVPAIILFTSLFWFPRSPRWLASKDRWDEVLSVLAFLRTPNCDINDPLVLAEYKEIEEQIRAEREEDSASYRELLGKRMRKRLFLAMAIQAWSQLTGINLLLYFIVYILEAAGIPNTLLFSSIQYILFAVATIPSILWLDHWGRRLSLIIGSLSMAFWLYLIGGLFARFGEPNPVHNQAYTWIIVDHPAASHCIQASTYLAAVSFAMFWGPVSWTYPPEIIPLRIRAKAVSLSTSTNWAINYALGFAVPPLLRAISWRLFVIFASFNVAAFIHIWFRMPETKKLSLEEMDEIFEHGEPIWRSLTNVLHRDRLDALARDIENSKLHNHRIVHVEVDDGPGRLSQKEDV
ncbi:general substrate transporter [Lipomyces orientalis]|uniref:General substrate transporter n=1 Tax=Lipomyces orientalis TaxID=1233043 RepID=A0ACC3TGN4_9ASCO